MTKLKPRGDVNQYSSNNGHKSGSTRDYNEKKLQNRLKPKTYKDPASKRKVSMGKKKGSEGSNIRNNNNNNNNNNSNHYSNGNKYPVYENTPSNNYKNNSNIMKKQGVVPRKHPQPNKPPPLPENLQLLSDQKRKEKEDLDFMRNTLQNESEGKEEPEEYFNFQEKLNKS